MNNVSLFHFDFFAKAVAIGAMIIHVIITERPSRKLDSKICFVSLSIYMHTWVVMLHLHIGDYLYFPIIVL